MFSRISPLGVVMEDLRSLTIGLLAISMALPVLIPDLAAAALGTALGIHYGYRIEKHMHEIRTLGGRILKAKSWDYLVLS
jgi:hypothetical protein